MKNIEKGLLLALLATSLGSSANASSEGVTVYPPANLGAGSGLLYFPEGGDSSLYAVPVISSDLTSAVTSLNTTLNALNANTAREAKALEGILAALGSLQLGSGTTTVVSVPSSSSSSSSAAATSGGYVSYPSSVTCSWKYDNKTFAGGSVIGSGTVSLTYQGLQNATYIYVGSFRPAANYDLYLTDAVVKAVYDAATGKVLNASVTSATGYSDAYTDTTGTQFQSSSYAASTSGFTITCPNIM